VPCLSSKSEEGKELKHTKWHETQIQARGPQPIATTINDNNQWTDLVRLSSMVGPQAHQGKLSEWIPKDLGIEGSDVTLGRRRGESKMNRVDLKKTRRTKKETPGMPQKTRIPEWVSHLSGLKKPQRRG